MNLIKKIKKPPRLVREAVSDVPEKGLEPPRLAALAPEASASTNFATRAFVIDKTRNSGFRISSVAAKVNFQL